MKKTINWTIFVIFIAPSLWADSPVVTNRFKCMICKNLKGHIQEFVPIVEKEIVPLNNGTAILQTVRDSAKLDRFHIISRAIDESLKVMMTLTTRGVKNKLCPICKRMYKLTKMGGRISRGQTMHGDLTVYTSTNQSKNSGFYTDYIGFLFWDGLAEHAFATPIGISSDRKRDRAPELLKKVPVKLPQETQAKDIRALVEIGALVGKDGRVKEIKIVGSTDEILNQAVMDAVKEWIFEPAKSNGKKVEAWYYTRVFPPIIQ